MTAAPTGSEARALLGAAMLERYDRDGDEAALSAAIAHFRDAIAAAPDDAVPAEWLFWVGAAHVELAHRRDSLPDYDLGIAALTDVLDCLRGGDSNDGGWDGGNDGSGGWDGGWDDAAAIRMEASWRRFELLAYGDEQHDHEAALERLMLDLRAFPLTGSHPEHADLERVLHGLAHLERYWLHHDRGDLDRAIATLGAATGLGLDDRLRHIGRAALVDAYVARAALDGDPGFLDLAVAEGEAALGGVGTGTFGWRVVAPSLAFALHARDLAGEPPDPVTT